LNSRRERAFQNHRTGERGFTLLELVISLLLSSVVILIIVSVLQLAVRSEEKGTKKQDESQHVRVLVAQMSYLLRGAYPYRVKAEEKFEYYFDGEPDSLGLITSSVTPRAGSLVDKPGLKWVRLFSDSEGLKVRENFFFSDSDYEEGAKERLLDDSVTGLELEYLDTGEDGKEMPQWSSSWSTADKDYLPAAVRLTIGLRENGQAMAIHPFTVKIQISKTSM